MRAKHWAIPYWIWMALLAAAFYAWPSWHIPIWSAIGLTSASAVVVGVIRNRPRKRAPWFMLGLALLTFAAGDTTFNLLTSVGHEVDPFPSAADLFYVITCLAQIAGMYGLVRAGTANRDRSTMIDSLVLTSGVGLIYWIFLISPMVHRQDLTGFDKIISVAYPLSDVLVLALVARLVVAAHRTPAVMLLAVGTAGLLCADVLYGLIQLHQSWNVGGPVDLGWILLYATWGAAALHPSMVSLTEPRTRRPVQMGRPRLIALAISSLVAPASLLIEAARGHVRDASVIAVLSVVVFLLIMVRLADVLASNRLALERERALRQSGDAMVSATDSGDVQAAIEVAIARMVPTNTSFHVAFLDGELPPAAPVPGQTSMGAQMRYATTLSPMLSGELPAYELALVCPLPNREPSGPASISTVVVLSDDEDGLAAMTGPMEVLSAQAALALERITLTTEVNRRKSEEYFRTLVQNTADVILIVDEDHVIGYASPSASSVFGDQVIVGTELDDLLRPDEQVQASGLIGLMRARSLTGDRVSALTAEQSERANADWVVRRPDGAVVHVEASTQDLSADPTVQGIVVTLRDVTDRRRLERELTHHAFHDPLTGVANRLLFQERVRAAVERSDGTGGTVGVLFIDLDDFKIVNDTMGHHAGDQLLVAVAERLGEVLRPQDTVARLGGDEFAALIEDLTEPADIEAIATKIIDELGEPFFVSEALVSGASSIGVATTAEAADVQDLLRQADLALYVAKGSGKGQWRRYQSDLHTAVLKRMQTRTELDQAHQGRFLRAVLPADRRARYDGPDRWLRGAGPLGSSAVGARSRRPTSSTSPRRAA